MLYPISVRLTISRRREGLITIFFKRLRNDLGLHALFQIHLLQAPDPFLRLLHPSHHRGVHPAVLGMAIVERGSTAP